MRLPSEVEQAEPCRILIVDDDRLVRAVLARMLEHSELDCEVVVAEDGIDACVLSDLFRPHLIVLDVVMPQLGGAELCRAFRNSEKFAETRVLLISGYGIDDPRVQDAMALGAMGFITKPVSQKELVAKVSALLHRTPPQAARLAGSAQGETHDV